MQRRLSTLALATTLLACSHSTAAETLLAQDLNESIVKLPVSVSLRDGSVAHGEMLLTTFKPAGPGPFPIAIINHGRSATQRSTPERVRMPGMASYLVRQGFAVFVPTRLGYGLSVANSAPPSAQQDDPENSGDCSNKDYPGALEPAVQQIAATLNYARQQPYAEGSRHFVVGQSMGGLVSVAYAATQPAGLIGYVNFAGGGGGNPMTHPGVPCQPERLGEAYARYGQTTRVTNLWIYTENDQYFAPRYSRAWHNAFAAGGSSSQLLMQAPFGQDGHRLMTEGLTQWRPLLDNFLATLGLPVKSPPAPPTPSGHAHVQDILPIPWLFYEAKLRGYTQFLAATPPRAFAISRSGHWGWANGQEQSASMALAQCNRVASKPCVIYAIDNTVVWRASDTAPMLQP